MLTCLRRTCDPEPPSCEEPVYFWENGIDGADYKAWFATFRTPCRDIGGECGTTAIVLPNAGLFYLDDVRGHSWGVYQVCGSEDGGRCS